MHTSREDSRDGTWFVEPSWWVRSSHRWRKEEGWGGVGASNLVKRAQRETKMRISASHAWRESRQLEQQHAMLVSEGLASADQLGQSNCVFNHHHHHHPGFQWGLGGWSLNVDFWWCILLGGVFTLIRWVRWRCVGHGGVLGESHDMHGDTGARGRLRQTFGPFLFSLPSRSLSTIFFS